MFDQKSRSVIAVLFCFCSFLFPVGSCKKVIPENEHSASEMLYLRGGTQDKVNSAEQTRDGGFIFCGKTISGTDNAQAFMMKTNAEGKQEWYKTYGDEYAQNFQNVIECSDGNFIAVGSTTMQNSGALSFMDYVVKTDASGNVLWSKSFTAGDLALCELWDITEGPDKLLYATGYYPSDYVYQAVFLLKFTLDGTKIFQKKVEALPNYEPKKFNKLTDVGWSGGMTIGFNSSGDLMIGASTVIYEPSFETVPSLISVKNNGTVNFYYPYHGKPQSTGYSSYEGRREYSRVYSVSDGYMFFWNRDRPVGPYAYPLICMMKTDLNGNPLWQKEFMVQGSAVHLHTEQLNDGSFLISGTTTPQPLSIRVPGYFFSSSPLVLHVDADGKLQSQYQGQPVSGVHSVLATRRKSNGDILIAGFTTHNQNGYDRLYVSVVHANEMMIP